MGVASNSPSSGGYTLSETELREWSRLLARTNDTARELPHTPCIHTLIEAQVERTPEALAVTFQGTRLSYRELDQRANQLAHHLRALGVGPEVLVALCVERSADAVVALLAILKAGGAYLPLDPGLPSERLALMLRDSRAPVLVVHAHLRARMPEVDVRVVQLDGTGRAWANQPTERPHVRSHGDQLAYVNYTSGSTGQPKGVCVPHRGIIRMLVNSDHMRFEPTDRVAQVINLSFDPITIEIWGALLHGARLVVIPQDVVMDPERYAATLHEEGITILGVPSAFLPQLARTIPGGFGSLNYLMVGGDTLSPAAVREVFTHGRPRHLVNLYGPTEVSSTSTCHEVREVPEASFRIPIGLPIANTTAHVLRPDLSPTAPGEDGELYLGGPGVARGYLGHPALTAERFVPDPFATEPGARLYRTGDLVRRLSDGTLDFIGRIDRQVKVRGFRIEPGEVETALLQCTGVREAVVEVFEPGPADKRLVAYLSSRSDVRLEVSAVRQELLRRLPEYMVPSAFIVLEALPVTANGKVDRRALPAPTARQLDPESESAAPCDEVERMLVEAWAEVLGRERVGIHDNFFELGGDSIQAIQLSTRLQRAGLRVTSAQLFAHQTPAELAAVVGPRETPREQAPVSLAPREPLAQLEVSALERLVGQSGLAEDVLPLGHTQQGILFHVLDHPDSQLYLEQLGLELRGPLEATLLTRAWERVVQQHPALRASFHWRDLREPLQVIHRRVELPFTLLDWSGSEPGTWSERFRELGEAELQRGFELTRAPLMRLVLVRLAPGHHYLLWSAHHLLLDGWSYSLILQQVLDVYTALVEGRELALEKTPSYRDYLAWLKAQEVSKAESYWRGMLGGMAGVNPLAVRRPASAGPGQTGEQVQVLSPEETTRLQTFARQHQLTLHTLVQGAWALLLGRYGAERSVVFGTTVAGRPAELPGVESMVGLFIQTLPLRVELPADARALPFLRQLQTRNAELRQYECTPLADIQRWAGFPGQSLFESIVLFENFPLSEALRASSRQLQVSKVRDIDRTHYPLTLLAIPGQELTLRLRHDASVDAPVASRLVRHLRTLLLGMSSQPEAQLDRLPLLPDEERQHLLVAWNDTTTPFPHDASIPALFEAQVARTPEAVALVFEDSRLTYRELDARANQLAHHLRSLGVGPDSLVGLCLERSLELGVALLAILKAGGAYVPLDPMYPRERLSLMVEDSRASLVLTRQSLAALFEGSSTRIVPLDEEATAPRDTSPLPCPAGPSHLAYVLYTSGSTGRPKGVMVTHRNVANFFTAMDERLGTAPGTWFAVTSISFDISVLELLWTLCRGFKVVVRSDEVDSLPAQFVRHGITHLQCTPSLARALLLEPGAAEALAPLQKLLVGGEALPDDLAQQLLRTTRAELLDMYGPTETTVWSTTHSVSRSGDVALGTPIANTRVYVLDTSLRPVPIGVPGELFIGGEGVVRGYLRRPELTAERFIADPFSSTPGARLYRTGDLVRWREDGTLEYLGRMDLQVKLRGHRIELGEIEAALHPLPGVRDAVVVAREDSPGDKRLVAYVVAWPDHPLDGSELGRHLARQLPQYMVPSAFVLLEALPLTPNGKVDRKALLATAPPRPTRSATGPADEPPRNPTEKVLADLFAQVLNLPRVGIHDDFFDLGGHSMLATQLASRSRAVLGVDMPVRHIFDYPTVASLAEVISRLPASMAPQALNAEDLSDAEVETLLGEMLAKEQDVTP